MKPTQQEIIELAREHATRYTNRHYPDKPVFTFTQDALQKVIELALERFGAGGGEPVAWMGIGKISKTPQIVAFSQQTVQEHGVNVEIVPLCTHPSPTNLRDAYYEGFMASGEGWNGEHPFQDGSKDPRLDGRWCQTRDNAIEALKGKQ